MANENIEPGQRRRGLFRRASDADGASEGTQIDMVRALDGTPPGPVMTSLVQSIRAGSDEAASARLDSYLVDRITDLHSRASEFDRVRARLEHAFEELRAKCEGLLKPPFYPARFIGIVPTPSGDYANVVQDGAPRLVSLAEGLSAEGLASGDRVFLCHERNAAIVKAVDGDAGGEVASVVRRSGSGHVVINDRDVELIVPAGAKLADVDLKAGDRVVWDRSAGIAIDRFEQTSELAYEDFDDTLPEQLGGHDEVRDRALRRFVLSVTNPEEAQRYRVRSNGGRRLLFWGAPGTGKTLLMKVIAASISRACGKQCRVVSVTGAELFSPYVGQTEQKITRCFTALSDYDGPGILFVDEIDAIGRVRGNASGWHDDRFLNTLLGQIEGMRRTDVALIAATNRADALDPALRARFSWEIEMPRPDMSAAREIFRIHLHDDIPYRPNGGRSEATREALVAAGISRLYDPNADNELATLQFRDSKKRTIHARELVSGRLIRQICDEARESAFERCCLGGEPGIGVDDMRRAVEQAVDRLRSTLTRQNAKSYLSDLPQDVDVVSVEPVRSRVRPDRYARETRSDGRDSTGTGRQGAA